MLTQRRCLISKQAKAQIQTAVEKKVESKKDTIKKRIPKVPLDILVCTPDITSEVTQRCLASLIETTSHIQYILHIEDNRGKVPFIHAKAINRHLDMAKGNLVICDDDITFSPGWLDKALDLAETHDDIGIIGFHLQDHADNVWGSAMYSGRDGKTQRCMEKFTQPCCIPSQCSACWLITKTDRRFDERYNKYRFEHVFALQSWEDGKKVWSVPATIYHDCCTQFRNTVDSELRLKMCNADEALYKNEWLDTGREWDIMEKITPYMPDAVVRDPEFGHEHPIFLEEKKVDVKERRALVTVAVGDAFKIALPLFRRYAKKINADLFVIDETWMTSETTPHFLKWKCNAILAMGYTRIAFVDADIVIMPNAPDIFDAVSIGTLGVFDEAPVMWQRKLNRADTCKRFVASWERQIGKLDYTYPGHYFNSGVMVFNSSCNPLIHRDDGVYSFNTDTVFDQTYLNVMAAKFPKTLLDWRWNRMAITQAHEFIGSNDMFFGGAYFLHYCGNAVQKAQMLIDLDIVYPPAVERLPGPSLEGLYDLCAKMSGIKRIVEIGSAHGESAWVFSECFPDAEIICVDPWGGGTNGRYGEIAKANFDARHGWNDKIKTMRMIGDEAAKKIPDGSLDFVYIDALHEYEPVKSDIATWVKKVAEGGWIGGHDYNTILWPGCVRAVNEAFIGPDFVFQDSSWLKKL